MPNQPLSLVVPSFERGEVLLRTLEQLLRRGPVSAEIIVVDQSRQHPEHVARRLNDLDCAGVVRWLPLAEPDIPRAMNIGLRAARSPIVLFLDDDVIPSAGLVAAHARAHGEGEHVWAVAGQVLQPGEAPQEHDGHARSVGFLADLDFPFSSTARTWVANVMAGNLSVKRDRALQVGGFDENFAGVAYRFESEFARRLIAAGGRILFEPEASIRHLRASRGGTRSAGSHLTSSSPAHGMGAYYFALRSGLTPDTITYMLRRPLREVSTRFHLRHPWYVPVKLVGEFRAFCQAVRAAARGPRLLQPPDDDGAPVEAPTTSTCRSASAS